MKWFVGSLLVFCLLFQTVNWQQSMAQAAFPDCPCSQSSSSWGLLGGLECAHGPEHNAECRAMKEFIKLHPQSGTFEKLSMCQETNGGVSVTLTDPISGATGTFACKCYECGQPDENGIVGKCEGYRVYYEAKCGLLETGTQGSCVTHDSLNEEIPAADYTVMSNFNNIPCDYTSGFQTKQECVGIGFSRKVVYSCLQPYGPTQCIVDTLSAVPHPKRIIKLCGPEIGG